MTRPTDKEIIELLRKGADAFRTVHEVSICIHKMDAAYQLRAWETKLREAAKYLEDSLP